MNTSGRKAIYIKHKFIVKGKENLAQRERASYILLIPILVILFEIWVIEK